MPFVSSVRGNFGLAKRPFPISDGKVSTGSSGGSITTAGGYQIHTFTSPGAATFTAVLSSFAGGNGSVRSNGIANTGAGGTSAYVEVLMIAGGGGGGSIGGGGGAGGYIYGSTAVASGSNPLNIGAGGNQSPSGHGQSIVGTQGGNSTGFGLTAIGGGFGCGWASWQGNSGAGGSSGGGTGPTNASSDIQTSQPAVSPGLTQVGHRGSHGGQGAFGEPGMTGSPDHQGGGGGGAGARGIGRGGGAGLASSITGSSVNRGGGGGGGVHAGATSNQWSPSYSTVGIPFGGGIGAGQNSQTGTSGAPNTGGGGGGGFHPADTPTGGGGSGIIVVRYLQ